MPDEKSYTCTHVLSGSRPVLYVAREDGELIFACGSNHHEESTDDWKVVHSGHLVDLDASLTEVIDVPDNQQAERTAIGSPWVRGQITD